jgi:hypothetical protein
MAVICRVLVIDGVVSTTEAVVRDELFGIPAGVLNKGVATALPGGENSAKLQLAKLAIINPPNTKYIQPVLMGYATFSSPRSPLIGVLNGSSFATRFAVNSDLHD